MMRLPDFILANVEPILGEWEAFARSIWPGPDSSPAELRDHAEQILRATVRDMTAPQSPAQRSDKSRGRGPATEQSQHLDDASQLHGAGRVESGFKLMEVIAEYRALRASVIRLWRDSRPNPDQHDLDELTRFHESIDQSLTRAVHSFTQRIDQSRHLFLAILGHDLRNPLNALTMSAQTLAIDPPDQETAAIAHQINTSANAMATMIDDLLTFTAAGLGGTMPLNRSAINLDPLCREVIREMSSAHPGCNIRYHPEGDLAGEWDPARLREAISNLLGNAIQHGGDGCAVTLRVQGSDAHVEISVHNQGGPIPPSVMATIFDPLRRKSPGQAPRHRRAGSIGLGLYIVQQVVTSHGGSIHVTSTQSEGTTFTLRLPRHAANP